MRACSLLRFFLKDMSKEPPNDRTLLGFSVYLVSNLERAPPSTFRLNCGDHHAGSRLRGNRPALRQRLQEDHTPMNVQLSRRTKETKPRAPASTQILGAAPAAAPTRQPVSPCDDLHILIAKRAYELYRERGYRHGYAIDDWLDAEREILSQIPPV